MGFLILKSKLFHIYSLKSDIAPNAKPKSYNSLLPCSNGQATSVFHTLTGQYCAEPTSFSPHHGDTVIH